MYIYIYISFSINISLILKYQNPFIDMLFLNPAYLPTFLLGLRTLALFTGL